MKGMVPQYPISFGEILDPERESEKTGMTRAQGVATIIDGAVLNR